MADVYIAPTGNDNSGTGAEGAPYFTLGYALSRISAGETVFVAAGDYDYGAAIAGGQTIAPYNKDYLYIDATALTGGATKNVRLPASGTAHFIVSAATYLFRDGGANGTLQFTEYLAGAGVLHLHSDAVNAYIIAGSSSGSLQVNTSPNVQITTNRGFIGQTAAAQFAGLSASGSTLTIADDLFYSCTDDLSSKVFSFDECTISVGGNGFSFTGAGTINCTMDSCDYTGTAAEFIVPYDGATLQLAVDGGAWSVHSLLSTGWYSAAAFTPKISFKNMTSLAGLDAQHLCTLDGDYGSGYVVFKNCAGVSGKTFITTGNGSTSDCLGIESIVVVGCTGTFKQDGIYPDRQFAFGRFDDNEITIDASGSYHAIAIGPEAVRVTGSGEGDGIGYFSVCNNHVTFTGSAGHAYFVGPGAANGHVVGNTLLATDNANVGIGLKHAHSGVIVTGNYIHTDGYKAFTIKGSSGAQVRGNVFITTKTTASRIAVVQINGDADDTGVYTNWERPERNILENNIIVGIGNTYCVELVNMAQSAPGAAPTHADHCNNLFNRNCYWKIASGGYTPLIGHLDTGSGYETPDTIAAMQTAWQTIPSGDLDDLAESNDAESVLSEPLFLLQDELDTRTRMAVAAAYCAQLRQTPSSSAPRTPVLMANANNTDSMFDLPTWLTDNADAGDFRKAARFF